MFFCTLKVCNNEEGWLAVYSSLLRCVVLILHLSFFNGNSTGFQALQSHRVAHCLWNNGKNVLAHFLQSQVSQIFQIDIHPNATLGEGIMLDHGTGIVMGETAMVRSSCPVFPLTRFVNDELLLQYHRILIFLPSHFT